MLDNLHDINRILDAVFAYGSIWIYLVIFAACFIENIFPPFPGDTFIVAAGGLVGLGRLDLSLSLVAVILGGTASVMTLYAFGQRYGRAYFIRKNFKYFTADDIHDMERQFAKWGGTLMIFSRFIVGFRSALAVAAGVSEYHPFRMLAFSVISYLLFAGLLFYFSITLVDNFDVVDRYFVSYGRIVWPLLSVSAALYIGRVIYRHVRRG